MQGLDRYPEFKQLAHDIATDVVNRCNTDAWLIKSEMPYKGQFVLEEVIRLLERSV